MLLLGAAPALAQSGLSDDRVSLPDGPGSIGGVGENVALDLNMGSASFSVPVQVPTGATAAITPSLSLNYASGRGMGTVGIGWDLASPTITRTISKGLPQYTTADQFAADGGSELVYVNTTGGARLYRERFEGGFVRYQWKDAGTGAAGYWIAEYPDGRIGYFGATASGVTVPTSRVQSADGKTFRYHLVELVDTVGRRIVRTYAKDNGWVLPDEIQYGFGAQTTPRFSVRFGYEARTDIVSDATPGYEIRLAKRLSEIRVLSEAEAIRRYVLAYEADGASGGLSRLQRVTEFGRRGGKLPIEHTFGYSRTLTGACSVGCEKPFIVDMGTLPGGVDIQTGRASLIDINGDSLPDVLSSTTDGKHTFHLSTLSTEGRSTFTAAPRASAKTTAGSSFVLGSPGVQLLDVNGDGFTDLVDQVNGKVLCNTGVGDWSGTSCIARPGDLPSLPDDPGDPASGSDPLGMRFFDFDNDKRIDLLQTPTTNSAFVVRNTGTGFARVSVDAVGAAFDAEDLDLTDVNGDGLQDPVMVVATGSSSELRYRLNLGFGHWGAWTTVAIADLAATQVDLASLEDLDGDGLSDIVVVSGNRVSYWRNRNGGRFDARKDVVTADVDGQIPERTSSETVLFADMNGNGTDDVTWIDSSGHVRFLELFPVRPNLLSRIENGIGWVRILEYGTSIAQRARDAGTPAEWKNPLPESMNVVTATDTFVTLTGGDAGAGVHERHEMRYFDGFFDGIEKSFRGYERVEKRLVSDAVKDGQEPGLEVLQYDVGRTDPYRNGLLVRSAKYGGPASNLPIREERSEYGDCPLEGVAGAAPPIRFTCQTASVTLHQEGVAQSGWFTVRTENVYDGYGNVTLTKELGVVNAGSPESPAACVACSAPEGLRSGACGPTCLGDERFTRRTWVVPGPDTNGAWLLGLPVRVDVGGTENATEVASTTSFYDGPEFVGLAAGKATRGLLTRTMRKISATAEIPGVRNAWAANGNLLATLDPIGSPDVTTAHRRDYAYDDRGLRVTKVTMHVGTHDLVQNVSYESSFLEAADSTDWRVVRGGQEVTPRNSTRRTYDEFGRPNTIARPDDGDEASSETYSYELASPSSRIVARQKVTGGEAERVICQDGRGRTTQTLRTIDATRTLVDGFTVFNSRGQALRVYQAYESKNDQCESSPPTDVPFEQRTYDSLGRLVEVTLPDASLHGTASVRRVTYGPLTVSAFDTNDTDPTSPHKATPRVTVVDGLGRTVSIERQLSTGSGTYRSFYDSLGHLVRVRDPAGHERVQTFDLAGRVTAVKDPNAGDSAFTYDAAGNLLDRTDARSRVTRASYDGLNRMIEAFDPASKEQTLERITYDAVADCTDCRNGAGRAVRTEYVLPGGTPGSDELGYDPRGRRVLLRRTLEGHAFKTTYSWDAGNRLIQAVYPDARKLDYTYDLADRPLTLAGIVSGATYAQDGNLSAVTRANGATERFDYDVLDRVSRFALDVGGKAIVDARVARDRHGNILAVTDEGTGAVDHTATYAYDAWYRLTSAQTAGNEQLAFAYDLADNLTSASSSLGAASAAHLGALTYGESGAGPNALTSAAGTTRSYDAAGQVTNRGDLAMSWDHRGRLTQAGPTTFAYSPAGERVVKLEDGGVTYEAAPGFLVRDGISSLYARFGSLRVARFHSAALATTVLTDTNGDGTIGIADAWLGRDGANASRLLRASARRLLHEASDAVTHLHTDPRGSLIASTDSKGVLVAERAFHPFGAERASTGFVDEHGFTGQELDASTGLLHFRSRYLDPTTGRWTSVDPAFAVLNGGNLERLGESTTGYAYVANDPVNGIDPTGLARRRVGPKGNPRPEGVARVADNALRFVGTFGGHADLGMNRQTKMTRRKQGGAILGAVALGAVGAVLIGILPTLGTMPQGGEEDVLETSVAEEPQGQIDDSSNGTDTGFPEGVVVEMGNAFIADEDGPDQPTSSSGSGGNASQAGGSTSGGTGFTFSITQTTGPAEGVSTKAQNIEALITL